MQTLKKKPSKTGVEDRIPKVSMGNTFTPRSVGIAIAFLVTLYLVSPGLKLQWNRFKVGDYPRETVLAEVNFEVTELEATKLAREQAASLTPPVYVLDPDLIQSSVEDARAQFDKIGQDALNPVFTREERIALISKYVPSSTSEKTLAFLTGLDRQAFDTLRAASLDTIAEMSGRGVLSDVPGSAKQITIYDKAQREQRAVLVDDVLTLKKAAEVLEKRAATQFPDGPANQRAFKELSLPFIRNTLTFDEKLTQFAQEEARERTPPVMMTFRKNQEVVQAGREITPQDLFELQAHANALSRANRIRIYVGNAILLVMVFGCFLFYVSRYRPEHFGNNKALLLVGILLFLTLATGRILIILPIPDIWLYLVPVAAGAILLSILVDDRIAIVYAFFISVLYAAQGSYRLDLLLVALFGSLVGIYHMRTIRRRSDIFWPGIAVAVANVVSISAVNLISDMEIGKEFIHALLLGVSNGLITAIGVVPGSLTPLESLFGIATNIRLLELSDLNHPLLKRLVMEAPGTYHHSLMVGNMAEAAAEQIGANSLLARVGSYYHDVGKINKPLYFSENQRGGKNKHDELTPSMSALVLVAHLKEGVELAREHRLNQPIMEFIQQHHGTSLMPYFFQKALEQDPTHAVNEETFRYPGPKPQTRETAICMLADSVEAASRTLVNPTHGRIKGLVEKIVNNKFVDSQLDECDLTLKDLHNIADSFVRVLAGFLHSRVEYPEEQTALEIKEKFEGTDTKNGAKVAHRARTNPGSN
ncbi:HDIG domain-containing protein [Candidatus Poribacteria bacterium]|nr:HDIG domain-containing protein [Candidatus Poribacteria bacterium]